MLMIREDGFPASASEFNDRGVCVARGACGRLECDACLAVVTAGVEAMRLLPAAMAAAEVAKHDKYARLDSKRHQSGPEAA